MTPLRTARNDLVLLLGVRLFSMSAFAQTTQQPAPAARAPRPRPVEYQDPRAEPDFENPIKLRLKVGYGSTTNAVTSDGIFNYGVDLVAPIQDSSFAVGGTFSYQTASSAVGLGTSTSTRIESKETTSFFGIVPQWVSRRSSVSVSIGMFLGAMNDSVDVKSSTTTNQLDNLIPVKSSTTSFAFGPSVTLDIPMGPTFLVFVQGEYLRAAKSPAIGRTSAATGIGFQF